MRGRLLERAKRVRFAQYVKPKAVIAQAKVTAVLQQPRLKPRYKNLVDAAIIKIDHFETMTFGDEAIAEVW